jgi:ABC-type transport system substrate-binding protein
MIVILLITGCGGDKTTTAVSTTPSIKPNPTVATTPAIKQGGILKVLYNVSPLTIPGWPGETLNNQKLWLNWIVFENLVRLGADAQPIPWLATKWEWAPDKKYITFTLREDVDFSDGTHFTAAAVKLDYDQLINDKDPGVIDSWDRVEVIDDYHVRIYLKLNRIDFWGTVGGWQSFIVSPTVLKQGLDYTKEHPVGTGPFVFKSFEKDVSMKMAKNPNYWQKGKPYLDGIEFYTVKELLTMQSMMEAGEADLALLQQSKFLKDLGDKGFNVTAQYGGTNFLIFDTAVEGSLTNDPNIRKAIEYAINKKDMADALGYGYLAVNNQISPPGNPSFNKDLPSRDYNPAKAKELLKAAGFETGLKLKIITDSLSQDIAQYVQQYLKDVGVTLDIEIIDNAKYWDYIAKGWNGILAAGYGTPVYYPSFLTGYFPPRGVIDVSCKIPDNIVTDANAAMAMTDWNQFKAASDKLNQQVFDLCLFVPLFSNAFGDVTTKYVKDANLMEYIDFNGWTPDIVWMDK